MHKTATTNSEKFINTQKDNRGENRLKVYFV